MDTKEFGLRTGIREMNGLHFIRLPPVWKMTAAAIGIGSRTEGKQVHLGDVRWLLEVSDLNRLKTGLLKQKIEGGRRCD